MTKREGKAEIIDVKGLLERDEDFLRSAVERLVHAVLKDEMTEAVGAEKGERTEGRLSYRSGYYTRGLVTRLGKIELRVPQDRQGEGARRLEIEPSHAARSIESRTPEGGSRRSYSSAISVRTKRCLRRWRRCISRGCRRGK